MAPLQDIQTGNTSLGIEFGSTRIKAVLIGQDHTPIATGSHTWENQLENGIWTYSLEAVTRGMQACYAALKADVQAKYGLTLETVGAIGISGMMHGYLAFGAGGELLTPFRTWRNTFTAKASEALTALFAYPIPHRWSIAHLYHAILAGEAHVPHIEAITTLAGYIHRQLTGQHVLGVGEASGMFPIDIHTKSWNSQMLAQFDSLVEDKHYPWQLESILPTVQVAGTAAGTLTREGAKLLDPAGDLAPGIPFCPPEGDAGTGMCATNSVAKRTGNVSAGTSIFLMAVLEKELKRVHPEVDLVTTPGGDLVAMVHCNNCTCDLDAWVGLFASLLEKAGTKLPMNDLYALLYNAALDGKADCGGLLSYNYTSGESITGIHDGVPLFLRPATASFTLENFMRMNLYSALGTLKIGLSILEGEEGVGLDKMYGHGGLFKTPRVGQQVMAAAVGTPVTLMATAGEGGPWGMALLAAFMQRCKPGESLQGYLENEVFKTAESTTIAPQPEDVAGFAAFMRQYRKGLSIEKAAAECFSEPN